MKNLLVLLYCLCKNSILGTPVQAQLLRRQEVRVVRAACLGDAETVRDVFGREPLVVGRRQFRRPRHPSFPAGHRFRMSEQDLWRHVRMFCVAPQLVFQAVLLFVRRLRLILW